MKKSSKKVPEQTTVVSVKDKSKFAPLECSFCKRKEDCIRVKGFNCNICEKCIDAAKQLLEEKRSPKPKTEIVGDTESLETKLEKSITQTRYEKSGLNNWGR